jgi:uncharacterized membrane protein
MRRFLLPLLALACANLGFVLPSVAAPQVRYRITPITTPPDSYLNASSLNNRGEVVGAWGGETGFQWRSGNLVDLKPQVHSSASWLEAISINNRSQIVGIYADPAIDGVRGFLLDRGQVSDVEGPPRSQHVFANLLNDRGAILGAAYDHAGNFSNFLNDQGTIEVFDPSFEPSGINNRGMVAGRWVSSGEVRAAIWRDGVVTPIAPSSSAAGAINDRGQVLGYTYSTGTGSRAFVWERGRLTPLPALFANQGSSYAFGINEAGRIVGQTVASATGTGQIATVWDNGQVADLNALICPSDPRRGFVSLTWASSINDRGEILATGTDSRNGILELFVLRPVQR